MYQVDRRLDVCDDVYMYVHGRAAWRLRSHAPLVAEEPRVGVEIPKMAKIVDMYSQLRAFRNTGI